ncbi:two-component system, OmpR family, sensor histidine kinase KdpD [Anaerolineae bacterium]|nr:two-component system, OmpR family, sensor histidine kinase KdpD [Anaerolineae bacterium]
MSKKPFELQIETLYQRLNGLRQKAAVLDDSAELPLSESIESLALVLEELEVTGEELRQQNEELIAAYSALEAERQRYRGLFEFAPDGYLVTDGQGIILEANRSAVRLLHVDWKYLIGKPLTAYIAENDRRAFRTKLNQLSSTNIGQVDDWEIWLRPRAGPIFPASITVSQVPDPDAKTPGLRWLFRDISKRVQVEAAEHDQRLYAEALRQATSTLNSSLNLETVLNGLLENIKLVIPYHVANIMTIEGDTLRLIYWQGLPNRAKIDLDAFQLPLSQNPTFQSILAMGESRLIEAVTGLPDLDTTEVYAWIATPIRIRGTVIGFLNLYGKAPTHYTPRQVQQVQAFADDAGIALTNAQLYTELQQHSDDLAQRVDERTRELLHSKEQLEAILNHSSDAIALVDRDGVVQQVNPAYSLLFQSLPGHALAQIARSEEAAQINQTFQVALSTGRSCRLELELIDKHAQAFFADIAFSPIDAKGGGQGEIICSIRDMTQRKLLEHSLRQMLDKEVELNRLKSLFIQTVSHEFRTPLALILLSSESLALYRDKLSPEQQTRKFAIIAKGVRRLTEMMEEIVTMSEAESIKHMFHPVRVDLDAFCRELLADTSTGIGHDHRLVFERIGGEIYGNADRNLLYRVLANLLTNAVKYSPKDSRVLLSMSISPVVMQFQVRDEGIGISSADLRHVFEAFYRGENTNQISGTGLGLSIVQQSLDLQGGTILVDSEVGRGSTFTVIIPQASVRV